MLLFLFMVLLAVAVLSCLGALYHGDYGVYGPEEHFTVFPSKHFTRICLGSLLTCMLLTAMLRMVWLVDSFFWMLHQVPSFIF